MIFRETSFQGQILGNFQLLSIFNQAQILFRYAFID